MIIETKLKQDIIMSGKVVGHWKELDEIVHDPALDGQWSWALVLELEDREFWICPSMCAFCVRYNKHIGIPITCDGCPIYKHTGQSGCGDTPYAEVCLFSGGHNNSRADITKLRPAVRKELDFVKMIDDKLRGKHVKI